VAVNYEALLVVSFGGPEAPEDVMPFLENVVRGRNVPRERLLEVAEHYYAHGGRSPLNDQNRALIAALHSELTQHKLALPIYWGNRNWRPFLADTIRQMVKDGVRRALAFVTSAYSSYSGCRQYREDIERARAVAGPEAPVIDKLGQFYNRPGYIHAVTDRISSALAQLGTPLPSTEIIFTAHSIPLSMAAACRYEEQLWESIQLVMGRLPALPYSLAYQSRSGPPSQPWLEPDIGVRLQQVRAQGREAVVVAPIGFISDHMEVLHDLDSEARQQALQLGLRFVRAGTAGTHPQFVAMIREMIFEALQDGVTPCPPDCCLPQMAAASSRA
jgi:ferrochelatase